MVGFVAEYLQLYFNLLSTSLAGMRVHRVVLITGLRMWAG